MNDDHLNLVFPGMVAGNSYPLSITITDDDGNEQNAAGCQLWLTVKTDLNDSDAEAVLQYEYLVPDDADTQVGKVAFKVPASETKDIAATRYYVDVQVLDLNSDVFTVAGGSVTVTERVTKALAAVPEVVSIVTEVLTYSDFEVV